MHLCPNLCTHHLLYTTLATLSTQMVAHTSKLFETLLYDFIFLGQMKEASTSAFMKAVYFRSPFLL